MILVTGGTGFIGGHLLERLCSLGEPVRCLARPKAAPRLLPAAVEAFPGDLATGAGVDQALDGVDTVIHLAGVTKALRPGDYYAGNARTTQTLVDALRGRAIHLVHVSSLAAMGPSRDGTPLDEDAEPRPLTHYGKSKLEAERIVRREAPEAVIVRPPVVYGPRDTDVFQMLRSISRGWALALAGGERWFSAIYVADLVDGLIAAARPKQARGRTYFLAHPKPVSWSELAATAGAVMGRPVRVIAVPVPVALAVGWCAEWWARIAGVAGIVSREKVAEARCPCWTCDTARARRELAFEAPTPLSAGLALTLAWYKEAGWLKY